MQRVTSTQNFPYLCQGARTKHLTQLISARAWMDVALALIDMELPQWQIRRIAYAAGEWYSALSRQRELPDWLDQSIEGRHPDLALAILTAFVEAQRATASFPRRALGGLDNCATNGSWREGDRNAVWRPQEPEIR